jgi:hypothetical protein
MQRSDNGAQRGHFFFTDWHANNWASELVGAHAAVNQSSREPRNSAAAVMTVGKPKMHAQLDSY